MNKDDYKLIKKALDIARLKHSGQVDKSGDDYIFHPVMVALECETVDVKIVALLHDVLEDTNTTVEELSAVGFNQKIIDTLLLTYDKTLSYFD